MKLCLKQIYRIDIYGDSKLLKIKMENSSDG